MRNMLKDLEFKMHPLSDLTVVKRDLAAERKAAEDARKESELMKEMENDGQLLANVSPRTPQDAWAFFGCAEPRYQPIATLSFIEQEPPGLKAMPIVEGFMEPPVESIRISDIATVNVNLTPAPARMNDAEYAIFARKVLGHVDE